MYIWKYFDADMLKGNEMDNQILYCINLLQFFV